MAILTQWTWEHETPGECERQGSLCAAVRGMAKCQTRSSPNNSKTTTTILWIIACIHFFFFTSGFFLHYLKIVSYIYSLETALPLTLIEASYWYPRLICLLPPNCIFSTNHQNRTLKHTIQCNILLFKNTRWLLSSYSNSYKFILSSCQQWLFIIFLCEDVHT